MDENIQKAHKTNMQKFQESARRTIGEKQTRRAFSPRITSQAILAFIKRERELLKGQFRRPSAESLTDASPKSKNSKHFRKRSLRLKQGSKMNEKEQESKQTSSGELPPLSCASQTDTDTESPKEHNAHPPTNGRMDDNATYSGDSSQFPSLSPPPPSPDSTGSRKPKEKGTSETEMKDTSDDESIEHKYLNRTKISADAFSLIEMFNSLDDDGDGFLSVETDMPIAYKMAGCPSDKYPKLFREKVDTFAFCKIIGALQLEQQMPTIEKSRLRMSKRISQNSVDESNAEAVVNEEKPLQLFLGGACNPTTWRKDIVIPFCQRHQISYYNPQVDEWHPDLVKVEAQAKSISQILLFVINSQTRGVASMVEATELVVTGRNMVLVLSDITPEEAEIREMTADEVKDLNRGRAYVADVAARFNVPIFVDFDSALQEVANRLNLRTGKNFEP